MDKGKHFKLEDRKVIANGLSHGRTLVELSQLLGCDPTSISKEIKRHLTTYAAGNPKSKMVCTRKNRYPFVCDCCPHRYDKKCDLPKTRYNALTANGIANQVLTNSRNQMAFTNEQLAQLNEKLFWAKDNNVTIYHMSRTELDFPISMASVYRLVNNKQLQFRRIDLPKAVKYRKRKVSKKYQYKENNRIDRSKRTYLDYLEYKRNHPNLFCVQMDYLGAIAKD